MGFNVGDRVRLVKDLSNDFDLVGLSVGDFGTVVDEPTHRDDYVRVAIDNDDTLTFHVDELEVLT